MNAELVPEYKRVMANLLNAVDPQQAEYVLSMIERISDDTAEIKEAFERGKPDALSVTHWISVFRIIRFSQGLKQEISLNYDDFVTAYQTLRTKKNKNADEAQLEKEIGDFLYRVDEISGDFDRLTMRLTQKLNKKLVELFGMQFEPGEDFYLGEMSEANAGDFYPILDELILLADEMARILKVIHALLRIKKFILPAV